MIMTKKTFSDLEQTELTIDTFLDIGDIVDISLMSFMCSNTMPITNTNKVFQMGEPYNINLALEYLYLTLIRIGRHWHFIGHYTKSESYNNLFAQIPFEHKIQLEKLI